MKSNQRWTRAVIGLMVAALAVLASVRVGALSAHATAPRTIHGADAAAVTPPWEPDINATFGGIDFFNAAGQQITGGSTTGAPLAAYAVAEHNTAGGATKATLYGATPNSGKVTSVGTGFSNSFSNEQLSDSTTFPIAGPPADLVGLPNPIVTGKATDESLAAYITDIPNGDASTTDGYGGMYQLRIKLSAAGTGTATGYASTDIKVTGTTWTQVYGQFTSPVGGGGSGPTPTSTSVTASPVSPVTQGTSVTFTASVTPSAAGTVQFKDGTSALGSAVPVASGTATFTTTTLPAATHSITAVFTPTDSTAFAPSTSTALSYVVNASGATPTATAIAANPGDPVTVGTSVVFTATITPSAPGTVQFMDGTDTLGDAATVSDGSATISTSALTVGTHSITAVFTSSSPTTFGGSTSPALSYEVDAAAGGGGPTGTATTLAASPVSPTTSGTSVVFTATVTPSAAGTVQFKDGTTNLGDAVPVTTGADNATASSAATTTLSVGTHPITAVFTPTDAAAFSTSTSPALSYMVNAAAGSGPATTTTTVTANPASPTTSGTSVVFTATVTPSAAGSVQFMDNGSPLGGLVTVTTGTTSATASSAATTTLSTSTHSITAVFTPSDSTAFGPSTSATLSYMVNAAGTPVPTQTALTASIASPTTTGTSVTFTATVTPNNAVGTVQFMNGTTAMGSPVAVVSGAATYTTAFGAANTYTITAVFTPTSAASFVASTSAAMSFVVTGATVTSTALAVSPATSAAAGANVQLTATVTPTTAVGSVVFYDGSTTLGTETLTGGSATLSTSTLAVGGTHSFVAIFTPTNSTATDPTAFKGSQSPAVAYTITAATTATTTLTGPDGSTLASDPTLSLGEVVTVQASGFTAGESVTVVVHSTPETLTPTTASSTGAVNYQFTVPSDLPTGAHSLVLTGATSQTTVTIDFSIASPAVLGTTTTSTPSAGSASLPFTGSDIELLAAFAILCTGAGIAMRTRKQAPRYAGAHEWRRQH